MAQTDHIPKALPSVFEIAKISKTAMPIEPIFDIKLFQLIKKYFSEFQIFRFFLLTGFPSKKTETQKRREVYADHCFDYSDCHARKTRAFLGRFNTKQKEFQEKKRLV